MRPLDADQKNARLHGSRIGVGIDVTDLKRREESFRLLLEKNPLPMWVYDNESLRFLAVNEAAIEHYGYGEDEFLAMTVLDIRPPEERQKMREFVERGETATNKTDRIWRHLKDNNTEIEVAIYTKDLPFEGHAASVVAAIDVTEQRQAERRPAHYARHDPLTNLGNRMALSEHIESTLARVRHCRRAVRRALYRPRSFQGDQRRIRTSRRR